MGKVILVGEHFVVHGGPALAVPVRSATVSVAIADGTGLREGTDIAKAGVDAMLNELGLAEQARRWDVSVSGPLPLGAGLGGSAALGVALLRALGLGDGRELAREVHTLERLAHGRPSGLDGMTVATEHAIWMPPSDGREPSSDLGRAAHAEVLEVDPAELALWIGVVPRTGTTREAVERVALWRASHPEEFAAMLEAASLAAADARQAVLGRDFARLGRLFDRFGAWLETLGLVTAPVQRLIDAARAAGAHGAKMSGAGLGGSMIAIAPEGLDLGPALRQAQAMHIFSTRGSTRGANP